MLVLRREQSLTHNSESFMCKSPDSACLNPTDMLFSARFCGLTRSPQTGSTTTLAAETRNWMFSYDQRPGTWAHILPQTAQTSVKGAPSHLHPDEPAEEPMPRYAHQVVYNPKTKTVFLHGGNAGIVGELERKRADGTPRDQGEDVGKEQRLDDFWQMSMIRFVLCYHLYEDLTDTVPRGFIEPVQKRSSVGQHI